MPVSKSAKRALRKSERGRERNLYHITKMKEAIRLFRKKIEESRADQGKKNELESELRKVISIISHTASKGVIHRNEARRRISRLTKLFNKATQDVGTQQ
ncbi:MAG: 30S ribosomal protein S20 [Candidatus Calescibacterium sp.]|nr:30S ribosomal protein S20 [Candidatus Calescibacterium sp.]MCX7734720.1 30S ribosomal protein S20 [bacterium]MDW8087298.1 30S ribosomal protein S20 [Candidatus Calescibacterium sp.]